MSALAGKPMAPITGEVNDQHKVLFHLPSAIASQKPMLMSYTSSILSTTVGFPLDSLKTRMQTHSFNSAFQCFLYTIKSEGYRGLFRGIAAPLVSTSFSKSLGVSIYIFFKTPVTEIRDKYLAYTKLRVDEHPQRNSILNNIPTSLFAGFLSGSLVSLFACPFEFTKLFSQIQILVSKSTASAHNSAQAAPKSTLRVARDIVATDGLKGLYSGYRYHLMRDSTSTALFFTIYETFKMALGAISPDDGYVQGSSIPSGPIVIIISGALSGVFTWATVFPIDTVKAMYQKDIVANILRKRNGEERLPLRKVKIQLFNRRMYRGLGPSVTRSIIGTVVFFSAFEYLMANVA
ncbi:BA75_02639T0 [Komagataella pastoris]|uniref:BA75_02639T0 n=1 Tax=Komagataella pastoris TaxID=4922 RepID=A0A1B2JC46_PICPA|nr:BA75_02639T0 [Komagataella pastoris]